MSGRCVPPRKGSFSITMSPGPRGKLAIAAWTDIGIEPKCTGMWSPIAITWPCASKMAQE